MLRILFVSLLPILLHSAVTVDCFVSFTDQDIRKASVTFISAEELNDQLGRHEYPTAEDYALIYGRLYELDSYLNIKEFEITDLDRLFSKSSSVDARSPRGKVRISLVTSR